MKHAILHMQYHDIEGILLENCEDFLNYTKFAEKEIELGIRSVFMSDEPVERWDHLCRDPSMFNAMFHLSFSKARMEGGNPLLKLDDVINQKYNAMIRCLLDGSSIIVNKVGGWCPVRSNRVTMLGDLEYEPILHYYIAKPASEGGIIPNGRNETTKWINLENDPNLESYTYKHLRELDRHYSHIRNMVHWRKQDFEKVFDEFIKAGGEGVWLYTTGLDIEQMYLYTNVAIECGLKKFIFNFKGGESQNIVDFVNTYKDNESIEFEYNYV